MSEILIQSKITTPQLHDKIVHRERLTSLLNENKNKNLIIVCAPAGFGKTTLVLDYLSLQKSIHAWFSIPHRGIEDPSAFFEYLIVSLKNIIKEFGNTTIDVMKMYTQSPQMSKELVYACTASLVNEFAEYFKDDITLVIDDLHYITTEKSQKWLKEFLIEILENIPSNLHLILVTRIMPDLTLTQFKAKRNILIIEESHLNFDEEETAALLNEVYKYKHDINDLKLLDENTKGWITGLHLLLQAYGEDFNKVKYEGKLDKEIIYDFFAKEIFDNLSPELQEFMMVTSLMESFDEELANSVLGIDNSRTLLTELFLRNLFIHEIHTIGNDKTLSYGYHALFRKFLNRRLRTSRIEVEINRLMEEIGDSYLKLGDEVSAIDYFLEAEKFDRAVKSIIKNFQHLYDSGKYDILWKWFNSIPEKIIYENSDLSYFIGYLYLYTNTDYEKSLHYINKALEKYTFENDEHSIVWCYHVKTHILVNTGKAEQAFSELENLLNTCSKPRDVTQIYTTLSVFYCHARHFEKAEATLEKAVKYCDDNKLDQETREILNKAFASLYFHTKHFEKAIFYYKKDLNNEHIYYNIIMFNCNIATAYLEMGDYANSIQYYNAALKLMEKSYSSELLVFVVSQRALLLQTIGDFEESSRLLEKVYPQAEMNNDIVSLWYYSDYLSMNYYLSDDADKCLKYLNLNRTFSEKLGNEYYRKTFLEREAHYYTKYEPEPSLEGQILDSYNYFRSTGFSHTATCLYDLSLFYLIMDRFELAVKYLIIYLKESSMGANQLLDSRNLIDFALACPELTQYKDKIHCAFTEFFDRPNIEGTSDEYKRKMKIEIENLYDINMKSFGSLEFKYRRKPVAESKWRRKKAKSILAYMMLNPKAKYSRDKIIDMFFIGSDNEKIDEIFRHEISAIRSVFKNPYLSILIYEDKMLYLNPDCYFKSDAEEFNKYYKLIKSSAVNKEEKIHACKDAIELYKGDFMEYNYEHWCEDLRDEFKNKFISISETLISLLSNENDYEGVILYSENLLKHDKLNELAYLNLVEAHIKNDKKKAANDVYSKMLKLYKDELSELPDPQILKKINNLIENR